MKYNDVINHPSLKDYFGKKAEKWIDSLNLLVEKKNLGEKEIDDKEARQLLFGLFKFTWLGFFFTFFWAAYHNLNGWIYFCIGYVTLVAIDVFFLGEVLSSGISVVPAAGFGLMGRSLLLASKADELNKTSNLSSPSWGRVAVAFLIIFGGILAAAIISEL
jgi:hypothetical protein